MRRFFLSATALLLLGCSLRYSNIAKFPLENDSSRRFQPPPLELSHSGITIELNVQEPRVRSGSNLANLNHYWVISSEFSGSSLSSDTPLFIGLSSEESQQAELTSRKCMEIPLLERQLSSKFNLDIDTTLSERKLTCAFMQSIDSFREEKSALQEKRLQFLRQRVVPNLAGSRVQLTLINFHEVPYYVVTEHAEGDCGWSRQYETFKEQTKITFELNAGITKPCKRIPDEEVDKVFDDLNVSITSTN